MKGSFRQSMAWLHTWAALLPGWLLFAIFLFGTTAFFQQEISRWMRPEVHGAEVTNAALDAADMLLSAKAATAASWNILLPSARGGEPVALSWAPSAEAATEGGMATLDPTTGQKITVRSTGGGEFLYRFHYDLHYMPAWLARGIVWIAGMSMLVAILSGIVTHKKIFADFFVLRFGKGQRSWLDAHSVTAVLCLPFHLMITYTGLATLFFIFMPWAVSANFPSVDAFYEAVYPPGLDAGASGVPAPTLPLRTLVSQAEAVWRDGRAAHIVVKHPGDLAAAVEIYPVPSRPGGGVRPLRLSGVTGDPIEPPRVRRGATATLDTMIDLHTGRFAGMALRWLYFLSGVAGTVMVACGLVLWTAKRQLKLADPARHFGFRLVERLNIGVIAGTPAGIAVYFLANRLLPLDVGHRADWEINTLFIAWGGLFVWTTAQPTKRAWIEALAVCALLYALVPVVSAFTTARGLIPSLIARDWVFVGFDLAMMATAACFAFAAWKVARHKPKARAAPRRDATPEREEVLA